MILPKGYECGACAGQGWFVKEWPQGDADGTPTVCCWCLPLMKREAARELAALRSLASACWSRGSDPAKPISAFIARCRARNLDRMIHKLEAKLQAICATV